MNTIPIILFGTIIFCALLAILGSTATKKFQDKGGYYYIGGPNGGGATQFFNQHPDAEKLFNAIDSHGLIHWTDDEIHALFSLGAKVVAVDSIQSGLLVISKDMALAYAKPNYGSSSGGTKGHIYLPNSEPFKTGLIQKSLEIPIGEYTTPVKQKSVVGNAVVGAIVAGGAGAVVGALNAVNKNNQNRGEVNTHYIMGDSGFYVTEFRFYLQNNTLLLKKAHISPDIASEIDLDSSYVREHGPYAVIEEVCSLCWD